MFELLHKWKQKLHKCKLQKFLEPQAKKIGKYSLYYPS